MEEEAALFVIVTNKEEAVFIREEEEAVFTRISITREDPLAMLQGYECSHLIEVWCRGLGPCFLK